MTKERIKHLFPETVFKTFSKEEIKEKIKELKTITLNIEDKTIIVPMKEDKDLLENNKLLHLYSQYLLHSEEYKTNLNEVEVGEILYCVNDSYLNNKFFKINSFIDRNQEYKEAINRLSDEEKQKYYDLAYNQIQFDKYIERNVHSEEDAKTKFYLCSIVIENFKIIDSALIFKLINTQFLKLDKINSFFAEIRLFAEQNKI